MAEKQNKIFYDETQLPKECLMYSEQNLGETKIKREENLREIISWIDEDSQLKLHVHSNVWLMYFLRSTKFQIEKAKRKLRRYYTMRIERVEWFSNRDPFLPEIAELLDLGVFLPLKQKDDQNRQVIIIRTAAHDPKIHTQNNVLKVGKMLLDLILHFDEKISIYGVVAVFDLKNVTLGHALQLPPTMIKRMVECWESYPCRTKRLEFVNAPAYVNAFLNTFRFFMTTKMKSRVCVTTDKPSINAKLPKELGGNGETYKELAEYWKSRAQESRQWYRDMETISKYDEIKN
ncbi:Retinol-binding protein pinta [Pseudolycoriella hygida]|uniref:Retinol-binding protein pinta n=1 Tax=Pseudolycoriella hygida TaxID=35572 RepID=A0A9Q0S833_9DIPT|nr:Retinol-binding protein pinta [Pseudolycoriella hygida]